MNECGFVLHVSVCLCWKTLGGAQYPLEGVRLRGAGDFFMEVLKA